MNRGIKRYGIIVTQRSISGLPTLDPDDRINEYTVLPDPVGEWVKYEDHMKLYLEVSEFYEERIRELGGAMEKKIDGDLKDKYQLLVNKWKNQADKSSDVHEQAWLYACAGDLENIVNAVELKCNCAEKVAGTLAEYPRISLCDWWVCPVHGYVKR